LSGGGDAAAALLKEGLAELIAFGYLIALEFESIVVCRWTVPDNASLKGKNWQNYQYPEGGKNDEG